MESSLQTLIIYTKLANEAERYDEMAGSIKKFVLKSTEPLSIFDRNLLSIAYKNVLSSLKFSWRSLNFLEENSEKFSLIRNVALEYKIKITNELTEKCEDIIELISICQARHKITDYEDQADYYRYIAEVEKKRPDYDPIAQSENVYKEAMTIARAHLVPTNRVRLGLALNYSVFFYEILVNIEKACEITKKVASNFIRIGIR
ncbi:hypothetical protein HZS_5357 [Henneguya salminicola]|nr:hypothetical protein HZS_5357 [Henneguya salminicola]